LVIPREEEFVFLSLFLFCEQNIKKKENGLVHLSSSSVVDKATAHFSCFPFVSVVAVPVPSRLDILLDYSPCSL